MNLYKIWFGRRINYHAGRSIKQILKNISDESVAEIKRVELIEKGVSTYEIERHELPIMYHPYWKGASQ